MATNTSADSKAEPNIPVPSYLVTLFMAKEQLQEAPESRERSIALTDLEKLIAWVSMYLR